MKYRSRIFLIAVLVLALCGLSFARSEQEKWLAKKPIVNRVEIDGNEHIPTDEIKNAISTRGQNFFQRMGLKGKSRLKKNSRQLDGAAVSYLYRKNGFKDVTYDFEYEMAADSSAIVKIHVNEGQCYYIDTVFLESDVGFLREKVAKVLSKILPGEVFNPYKLDAAAVSINEIYADEGYPYALVNYGFNPRVNDSTRYVIGFQVDPGPLTIIGSIQVDSLKYTSSRVVRRELTFKAGDLYSRRKLLDSRQRIYSTALFTYVDFKTNISTDSLDAAPNLTITCSEKKSRFIKVRTGAAQDSTYDLVWDLGLEIGSRNISGLGRQFTFEPSTSYQIFSGWRIIEEQFGFYYTEPWPFGVRMPLNLSLVWQPKLRRTEQNVRIETYSLTIGTLKEIGDFIDIKTGFEFESVDIEGIAEDLIDQFKRDEEIQVSRSIWATFERDSRLDPFVPRSGSVTRLVTRYYGKFLGGDKNFYKLVGEWSRYIRAGRWSVYAFRIKSGWARSFESDNYIPTTDLFYLGGANTLRGYKENSVGPKDDDGDPIGGKFYLINNYEYRRNLIGKFWFSLFLDIGGNWRKESDFKFRDMLASTGLGLQYVSPLGPIRLDYGQRIAWKPVEGGGRFHISILYAF